MRKTIIAGWALLTSKPAGGTKQQCYWCDIQNSGPLSSGFNVYFDLTADRFAFDSDAGDGRQLNQGAFVLDAALGSPSLNTWYHLISEFDLPNNQATIAVNNGTRTVLPNLLQPTVAAGKICKRQCIGASTKIEC